jgi:hypothetical protein
VNEERGPESPEAPDFGALYRDGGVVSPSMAAYLWANLLFLGFIWDETADSPDAKAGGWLDDLPPVAAAAADTVWLKRFARCFRDLADRIASGELMEPTPRCTGEEMALHLALDSLQDALTSADGIRFDLPGYAITHDDIHEAREVLFEDHDVLLLFDPGHDGIESDLADPRRFINLHPSRWFLPFD